MPAWRWDGEILHFSVRVSPRARADAIAGWHDEVLRVRVAAVPAGGEANRRLLDFLARCFGVPVSRVTLLGGGAGRLKRIAVNSPRRFPDAFEGAVARPGGSH